ncbi:sucrose phosphorylase [Schleiferilactobacillus perolens DSM 12744]|uniref:Sucrose phosphorylase n=2 Tax=Schleiferilactobacillus perolens TaxID=100468 RepID=A0A0R1N584_9LACO|nr:sucrose phosphorylase [Schleiferilactobacillus perolens DSM 12744]
MKNGVMLITYADSMGKNVHELQGVLDKHYRDALSMVHLLPFFPSSGDRGFAPLRYDEVDPALGTWADVEQLAKHYDLMTDFMVNHISRHSPQFQDWVARHNDSAWRDLFLDWDKFWPAGRPTQADIDLIYKRKDKAPVAPVHFADGTTGQVWNTFGEEQMDLDVRSATTQKFFKDTLESLIHHGMNIIRLDAFAYAVKKLDTDDFFVEPEIWDLLGQLQDIVTPHGVTLLPEIHEHYTIVHKLAAHGYYCYDFALPMILLHSLYRGDSRRLAHWLKISPMKQFTTLDTHDGLGVVDAKDLLSPEELDDTKNELYKVGANVKRKYSSAAYNNLDIYQINTTYYSALGDNDAAYLLARAVQMFAPGIPQVYYVGLLAGKNDLDLLEKTKEGRNINRHYYTAAEVDQEMERPVVQKLHNLLAFRNHEEAFDLEGSIDVATPTDHEIMITRTNQDGSRTAKLAADFSTKAFTITVNGAAVNL